MYCKCMLNRDSVYSITLFIYLFIYLLFIHASVSLIGRVAAGPAGQPGKPP